MTREEKTALFVGLAPVVAKLALSEYLKHQRRKRWQNINARFNNLADRLTGDQPTTQTKNSTFIETTCIEA